MTRSGKAVATNTILVIGVAGGTASGKTTVVEAILDRVGREGIAHIQHDSYYKDLSHLPLEERRQFNFDHPDALDTPLLIRHLRRLRQGHQVEVPNYDFSTYCRLPDTRTVCPSAVVIVEGILILAEQALRDLIDLKIYVDTDADLRLIRRIERDISERGRTVESVVTEVRRAVDAGAREVNLIAQDLTRYGADLPRAQHRPGDGRRAGRLSRPSRVRRCRGGCASPA